MEDWAEIDGFPPYEVSSEGRVRNGHTGRLLGIYDNGHGILQVVLRRDGRNHARAVHRLVAEGFDGPSPSDMVPIFVDGDRSNTAYENLVWKTRSFAVQWARQGSRYQPRDNRRVRHVRTGIVYDNALECAKAIGGLEDLVLLTAQSLWETTYMGSRFEFVRY